MSLSGNLVNWLVGAVATNHTQPGKLRRLRPWKRREFTCDSSNCSSKAFQANKPVRIRALDRRADSWAGGRPFVGWFERSGIYGCPVLAVGEGGFVRLASCVAHAVITDSAVAPEPYTESPSFWHDPHLY